MEEDEIKIIYDPFWDPTKPICLHFKNGEVYLNFIEFRNIFSKIIKEDLINDSFVLDDGGIIDLKLKNNELELEIDCTKDNVRRSIKVFTEGEVDSFGVIMKKEDFLVGYNYIYKLINN